MKIAVVLFNLGGPTSQKGVRPFLWNLFKDPCILRVPSLLRYPLAALITVLRTKKAQKIYALLGGGSPLNDNTMRQCQALQWMLRDRDYTAEVFMCMRYAPPMTEEVVKNVQNFAPDHVILLPLYPQFSTSTTKSSFDAWDQCVKKIAPELITKTRRQCCYPVSDLFIKSHSHLIKEHLQHVQTDDPVHLLFSAHGIPMDMIDDGDPYAFQVEQTVSAIMMDKDLVKYSHSLCYQSRVGPKKWLGPSIDDALKQCQTQGKGAVVIPISFVSDHSETLVELDIQYKDVAHTLNLPHYSRVASLSDNVLFMEYLANQVESLSKGETETRFCPKSYKACYQKSEGK